MRNQSKRLIQPLGVVLQQAGLVNAPQIEIALTVQKQLNFLRLGEILASQGCLKQETADFFVRQWPTILEQKNIKPLGQYFKQASLLDKSQIQELLEKQRQSPTWIQFGALAVWSGYIRQSTLDFFVKNLTSADKSNSLKLSPRKQLRYVPAWKKEVQEVGNIFKSETETTHLAPSDKKQLNTDSVGFLNVCDFRSQQSSEEIMPSKGGPGASADDDQNFDEEISWSNSLYNR